MMLAELALLGKIREIPEVLFQVRCYPGNAVALASQEQGTVVVHNPSKANRKTRRALVAWTDPRAAGRSLWLPIEEERCWEYMKCVRHMPLPAMEKAMCYCTVPAVAYWRCLRKFGGMWKLRLREAAAWAAAGLFRAFRLG
jgi:hypothetical protein